METLVKESPREIFNISGFTSEIISEIKIRLPNPLNTDCENHTVNQNKGEYKGIRGGFGSEFTNPLMADYKKHTVIKDNESYKLGERGFVSEWN